MLFFSYIHMHIHVYIKMDSSWIAFWLIDGVKCNSLRASSSWESIKMVLTYIAFCIFTQYAFSSLSQCDSVPIIPLYRLDWCPTSSSPLFVTGWFVCAGCYQWVTKVNQKDHTPRRISHCVIVLHLPFLCDTGWNVTGFSYAAAYHSRILKYEGKPLLNMWNQAV